MRRSCPNGIPSGKTVDCHRSGSSNFLLLPYYTYILKSLKDGGYYFGHTKNLDIRLKQHNAGKVRSTKSRIPFVVHYVEEFSSKTEAAKREYFFKQIDGYHFLKSSGII
ncbi:MAG: GIY-YIG nuclease family protein [Terrimonas sp.]|nr:GIY-YIG nuclease family protein [Terrimonas sp.]